MIWPEPPAALRLAGDEVHLWQASLDLPAAVLEQLATTLSPDEQERAARFRIPEVRARFTAARAILRDILGGYLGCDPAAVGFGYRKRGKPFLLSGWEQDVRFNLSHSHGLALYAVTLGKEVGVDLEQVRQDRDHDRLAQRFFSPKEAATLLELSPELRVQAFFQCWTRKEAYLKARGEGLAIPLSSFEVAFAPGEAAALLWVAGSPLEPEHWSLAAIQVSPEYAAALAVEGSPARLQTWAWHPASRRFRPLPPGS